MPRRPRPWWREAKGAWYVKLQGRQHQLAKGREAEGEAWAVLERLLADGPDARPGPVSVAALVDAFLEATERRVAPATIAWYERHLEPFARAMAAKDATTLRPIDVDRWLAHRPQADGTKHGQVAAIKRAWSWARKAGLIDADPLAGLERPRMGRRSPAMTPAEVERLIAGCKVAAFRDLLVALRETGARPSEVAAVTAADYHREAGAWVLAGHKTAAKTGRPRVVYLTPAMAGLTERLAAERPTGPLFLNRRGGPWTRNAIAWAFRRLVARLGLDARYTPYSLRKSYGTEALARGVPAAHVAELMGHRSTAMLEKFYSHLSERGGVLRSAAGRARGAKPDAESGPTAPEPPTPGPPGISPGTPRAGRRR